MQRLKGSSGIMVKTVAQASCLPYEELIFSYHLEARTAGLKALLADKLSRQITDKPNV